MATAAMTRRERKKQRMDPAIKLALALVPQAQVANGQFHVVDISNRTEGDQRKMVRSGETKTIKRKSHIEILVGRKTLTPRQGQLCQWYADQHEAGFATVGCTANYCGTGGGGFAAADLFARYAEQAIARSNYLEARSSINAILVPLFERVVIHQTGLGESGGNARYSRLSLSFRRAVDQLEQGIGHLVTER